VEDCCGKFDLAGETYRYTLRSERSDLRPAGRHQRRLQRLQWCRAIKEVDEGEARQLHLFADDATVPEALSESSLRLCLSQLERSRPRQWGGCWLALQLWNWLGLDGF